MDSGKDAELGVRIKVTLDWCMGGGMGCGTDCAISMKPGMGNSTGMRMGTGTGITTRTGTRARVHNPT